MNRRGMIAGLVRGLVASLIAFCCASPGEERFGRWQVFSEATGSHATSFNSLMFFNESDGLGLTALGLESTTDGGRNWTPRLDSGGTRGFYAMRFSGRHTGWILGTERTVAVSRASSSTLSLKPLLLRTNDGGTTWTTINLNDLPAFGGTRFTLFSSMCFDPAGKAWIAGDAGIVEGTIESDTLRTRSFTASSRALNSVACDKAPQVWAVGDGGIIMRYEGQQWRSTTYADDAAYFTQVKVVGPDIWLAGGIPRKGQLGSRGLLVSSRNGQDWEDRTPSAAETLYDLEIKGIEGWAVGANGGIYYTRNGGLVWAKERSPTSSDLLAIFLLDERRAWIGGDRLTVLGYKNAYATVQSDSTIKNNGAALVNKVASPALPRPKN